MKPELRRVGNEQAPIVVIDDFSGRLGDILDIAAALAPYPRIAGNYYPGLRRIIRPEDKAADAYAAQLCRDAAPFIGGAFGIQGFSLVEASFSIVTTAPDELQPTQRIPHFDTVDPNYLALLHYVNVADGTGTAFYRHRATGIERVTERDLPRFIPSMEAELATIPEDSGYINASNRFFEQIGAVEAVSDRLIIYQGSLLHSGIIPPGMALHGDPLHGRLTANLFIKGN